MGTKSKVTLQEFAEFLRDAAYADNLEHGIAWNLSVIHPRTNWDAVGFTGSIWHKPLDSWIPEWRKEIERRREGRPNIAISFSFDEVKGIYNFVVFEGDDDGKSSTRHKLFDGTPTFEEFKKTVIEKFGIINLYKAKGGKT